MTIAPDVDALFGQLLAEITAALDLDAGLADVRRHAGLLPAEQSHPTDQPTG